MEQSPSWNAKSCSASQEIPCFLWNLKVYYHHQNRPPPVPILSHISPVHAPSHFLKIRFNIVNLTSLGSSKWSRSVRSHSMCQISCLFSTKNQSKAEALWKFRNMGEFIRRGVVSTSPNPQSAGPPLVGCPRLLIQYIRSQPPYLKNVSPYSTWRRAMPRW